MSLEEIEKYSSEMSKLKTSCQCGHKMFINPKVGYAICDWCGRRVENEKTKFKKKLKEILEKEKEKNERS